jgi:hypothetical protein
MSSPEATPSPKPSQNPSDSSAAALPAKETEALGRKDPSHRSSASPLYIALKGKAVVKSVRKNNVDLRWLLFFMSKKLSKNEYF